MMEDLLLLLTTDLLVQLIIIDLPLHPIIEEHRLLITEGLPLAIIGQ